MRHIVKIGTVFLRVMMLVGLWAVPAALAAEPVEKVSLGACVHLSGQ